MVKCEQCGQYSYGVYERDGLHYFCKCGHPIPCEKPTMRSFAIEAGVIPKVKADALRQD